MVLAYPFLPMGELSDESLAVMDRADTIIAPDFALAELTSVVWQWTRHRDLSGEVGHQILTASRELISFLAPSEPLWPRALDLAVEMEHSPYDTLFVALAEKIDTVLVTYDGKLIRTFPERAIRPAELLT